MAQKSTTLKDILGAMLSDAIRAQHETNSYLNMISEQYAQDGRLAGMKLPSATIGELRLSLKYAIVGGIEQKEESSVSRSSVDKALSYICGEVSTLLIKTLVGSIQKSKVDYKSGYGFIDTLPNNKEFQRHLRRRFYTILSENKDRLLGKGDKLDEKIVHGYLINTAGEQLLDHEDLRGLFMQDDAKGLYEKIQKEFDRVLDKELDDIMRESTMESFRRIQRFGSLQVEIDEERLAQLPPEQIQEMTITIVPPDSIKVEK